MGGANVKVTVFLILNSNFHCWSIKSQLALYINLVSYNIVIISSLSYCTDFFCLYLFIFKFFIVIQLQLCAFSPHLSTSPQPNPSPSPTSTLPLHFFHVSFIVVPVIPSPHCPLPTPPCPLLDCS